MRTHSIPALVLIALFAIRCASTPADQAPAALDIQITQLPDSGFAVQNRGAVSVAYQMVVRNHSSGPVTLRSIEMRTVGRSPYSLRNEPAALSETIAAGAEATVPFSLWSIAQQSMPSHENTVWVNGTLHYTGAAGDASQSFAQSFRIP